MGGAASAVGVANPPWPCTAGGRHVSKPRLRQGQLPNGRYRPRGISGLTHRAAPPALYLGRLDPRRNGLDALGDVADAGGGCFRRLTARNTGAARAAALLLQGLVGVRQFVGDDERREEDQPGLADLAQILGELGDLGVDILRQAANPWLLSIDAAEGKVTAIHLDVDLAQISPPVRAAAPAWRARRRSAPRFRRLRPLPARRPPGALSDRLPPRAAPRPLSAGRSRRRVRSRRDLEHPLVFLQRADVGRARRFREKLRPLRP